MNPIDFKYTQTPITKNLGNTKTEQLVAQLCESSFLALWSYPSVYRKEKINREICDVLVVFRNHVIIFSDKKIKWSTNSTPEDAWYRWVDKAFLDSATQIYGAEKWVRNNPENIYVDNACKQKLPVNLCNLDEMHVHRVVVAHGAAKACQKYFGGSGSFIVDSKIEGDEHIHEPKDGSQIFSVGFANRSKGYVHVLNEANLKLLLNSLDTISDFVSYLERKEKFIESSVPVNAAGEEEMLAYYLSKLDEEGNHDFLIPDHINAVVLDEGLWAQYQAKEQRKNQEIANKVSYVWDELVQKWLEYAMQGKLLKANAQLSELEEVYAFLAAESRTRRRILAQSLLGLVQKTGDDRRGARIVVPTKPGEPFYVFLCFKHEPEWSEDEYRDNRMTVLMTYCKGLRAKRSDALDIIGIATESGYEKRRSEDIMYLDGRVWSDELQSETEDDCKTLGILENIEYYKTKYDEYPMDLQSESRMRNILAGKLREISWHPKRRCFCKSGKMYKNCCLKKGIKPPTIKKFKKGSVDMFQ